MISARRSEHFGRTRPFSTGEGVRLTGATFGQFGRQTGGRGDPARGHRRGGPAAQPDRPDRRSRRIPRPRGPGRGSHVRRPGALLQDREETRSRRQGDCFAYRRSASTSFRRTRPLPRRRWPYDRRLGAGLDFGRDPAAVAAASPGRSRHRSRFAVAGAGSPVPGPAFRLSVPVRASALVRAPGRWIGGSGQLQWAAGQLRELLLRSLPARHDLDDAHPGRSSGARQRPHLSADRLPHARSVPWQADC